MNDIYEKWFLGVFGIYIALEKQYTKCRMKQPVRKVLQLPHYYWMLFFKPKSIYLGVLTGEKEVIHKVSEENCKGKNN